MLFTPTNRDDIAKYYRHSFLKFKETGDLLFYISDVDNNTVRGTIEDGREFKLFLAEEEPYEVDYILPHKSFFQFGLNATMLERVPAKQYHRGITGENTQLTYKTEGGTVHKIAMGFEVLHAFVQKQKFFTLAEAMENTQKLNSMVLSPRMMYGPNGRTIYIDFVPVAKVASNTKKITMLAPIFEQEILDFLKTSQEDRVFSIK